MKAFKRPAVDRLPWDESGLDLRFQHYAPDLLPEDRRQLVSACLAFGLDAADAFAQILPQVAGNKRRTAA